MSGVAQGGDRGLGVLLLHRLAVAGFQHLRNEVDPDAVDVGLSEGRADLPAPDTPSPKMQSSRLKRISGTHGSPGVIVLADLVLVEALDRAEAERCRCEEGLVRIKHIAAINRS